MLKFRCDMCLENIGDIETAAALSVRTKAFAPKGKRGPIVQMELCEDCGKKLFRMMEKMKGENKNL